MRGLLEEKRFANHLLDSSRHSAGSTTEKNKGRLVFANSGKANAHENEHKAIFRNNLRTPGLKSNLQNAAAIHNRHHLNIDFLKMSIANRSRTCKMLALSKVHPSDETSSTHSAQQKSHNELLSNKLICNSKHELHLNFR